jgi:hypothetical protein
MTRPRRLAILAAIVALALPACSSQDAKVSDLVDAMEDADLTAAQARCIGEGFDDANFSQDQLNDIAAAETPDDYPGNTGDQIRQILDTCKNDSESSSSSSSSSESTESSESTTTTGG